MGRLLFQWGDIIYYRADTGNGGHTPKKEGGPKGAEHQPWVSLDDEPTKERLKQVTGLTELQLWQIQTAGLNIQNKQEHAPQKERLTARTFLKDLIFDPTGALDLEKNPVETLSKFVNDLEKQGISKTDLIQAWLATFPHFRFDFDENGLEQLLTDVGIPQEEQTQIIQAFNNIKEQAPNIEDLKQPAMFKLIVDNKGEPVAMKIIYGRNPDLIKEERTSNKQIRGPGGIFVVSLSLIPSNYSPEPHQQLRPHSPSIGAEVEGMAQGIKLEKPEELYPSMNEQRTKVTSDPLTFLDALSAVLRKLKEGREFNPFVLSGCMAYIPQTLEDLHTLLHIFQNKRTKGPGAKMQNVDLSSPRSARNWDVQDNHVTFLHNFAPGPKDPAAEYVVRMVKALIDNIAKLQDSIPPVHIEEWQNSVTQLLNEIGQLYEINTTDVDFSQLVVTLSRVSGLGATFPVSALHTNLGVRTHIVSLGETSEDQEVIILGPYAQEVLHLARIVYYDPIRLVSSQGGLPVIWGKVIRGSSNHPVRSARQVFATATNPLATHLVKLPEAPGQWLYNTVVTWTTGPTNPDPGRTFSTSIIAGRSQLDLPTPNPYGGLRARFAHHPNAKGKNLKSLYEEVSGTNRLEVAGVDSTPFPAIPTTYTLLLYLIIYRLQTIHPDKYNKIVLEIQNSLKSPSQDEFQQMIEGTLDPNKLSSPLLNHPLLAQIASQDSELNTLIQQAQELKELIIRHYTQDNTVVTGSDDTRSKLNDFIKEVANTSNTPLPDNIKRQVEAALQHYEKQELHQQALEFSQLIYNSIQQGHKLSPYVLFRIGTEVYNLDPTTTALILTQFAELSTQRLKEQLAQTA